MPVILVLPLSPNSTSSTALDLGFGLRGLDFGLGLDNEEYDKRKTMSKIKNTVPVNYDCF